MTPQTVAVGVAMHSRGGTVGEALLGGVLAALILFVLYFIIGFIGVAVQDISWHLKHRRRRKR